MAGAELALMQKVDHVAPSLPRNILVIKGDIHCSLTTQLNKAWSEDSGNRVCKLFMNFFCNEFVMHMHSFSKRQFSQVVQLATGHCHLAAHMHKIGLQSSQLCPGCKCEPETVEHFLCFCSSHVQSRREVFGLDLLTTDMLLGIDPKLILRFAVISGRFGEC